MINRFVLTALALPMAMAAQTVLTGDTPLTILQTTDIHHHANGAEHVGLDSNASTGAGATGTYARIAAYVNSIRASAGHPVVLVDSGDWTMGTLYDLTLGKQPLALSFFDQLKYDCVTLGNHEFDYAPPGLAQFLGAAQSSFGFHTPIVASNMNLGGSTDLAPFVGSGKLIQSTRVQDLANGIRVGYIGLMGESAAQDAPVSAPVTFAPLSKNYSVIQAMVDNLRNTQGVHVVIALSHSGTDATGASGEDVALAQHVTGIDVIASGHTHTPLSAAHTVANGSWNTRIVDAGAYGTNVARLDLTYHPSTKSTTMDASSSPAMTDAGLTAVQAGLTADASFAAPVTAADQQINTALGPFFTQTFTDYSAASLGKGIYHPVGTAAQDMVSNATDAVPAPNGLGDLVADSIRAIPNGIIAQTLSANGGDATKMPGYDFTPFQAGVVATGVIRGSLRSGVTLSFADVYDALPLGTTPDTTQSLTLGFPMISLYLEQADMKKVCALQLITQSGLAPAEYYLHISGIRYGLKSAELYTYFKYATAAEELQVISQAATSGSLPALQALIGVISLFADNGAGLLAAYGQDNAYAGALVKLNDASPTADQIAANLLVVAQLATASLADSAAGTNTLVTLVVSKAVAAIDTLSTFATSDNSNTGTTTDLSGTARVRVSADLYAALALATLQSLFNINITAYQGATGSGTLSGSNLAGILPNRINAAPMSTGVTELKEWAALLSYLQSGLKGTIPASYASSADFTQFAKDGAAVQTRNTSYPLAAIGQLVSSLSGLQGSTSCAGAAAPSVAAVTSDTYGSTLSGAGTIIVWGSGFSAGGGNSVSLSPAKFNATSGGYFWDLSANQINVTLGGRVSPGQQALTVTNACGQTSAPFTVTIQ